MNAYLHLPTLWSRPKRKVNIKIRWVCICRSFTRLYKQRAGPSQTRSRSGLKPSPVSKMKIFLATIVLALVAASAYGQLVTRTRGVSGPKCGVRHHCLTNSTCLEPVIKCVCPNNYYGNGLVGCVPKSSPSVFIQADPHLHTMDKEFLPLDTPCRFRLTEFVVDTHYIVQIFAANRLYDYKMGEYFINTVEVRIAYSETPITKMDVLPAVPFTSVLIEADTEREGQYVWSEYRAVGDEKFTMPTRDNTYIVVGDRKINLTTSYDETNNQAFIIVRELGLRVWFRPHDQHSRVNPLVPGLAMYIDEIIMNKVEMRTNELSSTPNGPSLLEQAKTLNMNLKYKFFTILLTLNNTRVISDSQLDNFSNLWRTCKQINRDFINICGLEMDVQKQMVNKCGYLYTDAELLHCVSMKRDLPREFLPEVFNFCLKADCAKDKVACETMKKRITDIGCKLPVEMRRWNCDDLPEVTPQ